MEVLKDRTEAELEALRETLIWMLGELDLELSRRNSTIANVNSRSVFISDERLHHFLCHPL
jgi:hypothetical protein